jgi:hypothetical protein
MITIAHICVNPKASPFNSRLLSQTLETINKIPIYSFRYLQTIKMIPIILVDQLLINPSKHEQIINDIVTCYGGVIRL